MDARCPKCGEPIEFQRVKAVRPEVSALHSEIMCAWERAWNARKDVTKIHVSAEAKRRLMEHPSVFMVGNSHWIQCEHGAVPIEIHRDAKADFVLRYVWMDEET